MDREKLRKEYEETVQQLSNPELFSHWEKMEELSKKKSSLEKILHQHEQKESLLQQIEEAKEILTKEQDPQMRELTNSELEKLETKLKETKKEIGAIEKGKKDVRAVIMELRPGTGGQEASLFAFDLFEMYEKYAQKKGWKMKILDIDRTELDGIKQAIFELQGENVYDEMKYEGGVHRVQRIPETEKMGRIHTSTASVAVFPKPTKREVTVNPQELKIDVYKASGAGGQYVNKRETAIRITHLPSGLVVTSQTERSLGSNKENALAILEAKLLEQQREREKNKLQQTRKSQIGTSERSEKIRTYNFPQDRITDHRIKESWHNIPHILEGNLENIVHTLQEAEELEE
jgi:peptide chain release factor 1